MILQTTEAGHDATFGFLPFRELLMRRRIALVLGWALLATLSLSVQAAERTHRLSVVIEPLMGHAVSPKFERASDEAITEHIARTKKQ